MAEGAGAGTGAGPTGSTRGDHRISIPLIALIYVVLHAIFAVELYLDLSREAEITGVPLAEVWSSLDGSAAMARASGTTISRAYNVLVSLVVTSIALAIPLTANMYTPKLIDIFMKDRTNIVVLAFFVISAAQAIWSTQATWDQGAVRAIGGVYPRTSLWVAFETITLGWAILIPYIYYVLRFLNPTTIIRRVADEVVADFAKIKTDGRDVGPVQRELEQHILHLGNVILRAIDRSDRDVTLDAIRALERVEMVYEGQKKGLPAAWFDVGPDLFVGLAPEAVEFIRTERIWVEHKCLHQLALAYNASLAKMQDAISAISVVTRSIALNAEAQPDVPALKLAIRFFNTFLREAVKKKDIHAIYDIFSQYKGLAFDLMASREELALEIGRHFKYYAEFARASGLVFVYELGCYEIESLVEGAHRAGSPVWRDLLDIVLSFEGATPSVRLVKAKAILGGYFVDRGLEPEQARLAASLAATPRPVVEQALKDLLSTVDPVFWEVTDRQMNFDFVDETRKRSVARFLERVGAGEPAPAPVRAAP